VDRLQPVTYADGLGTVLAMHREIRSIEQLLTQLDVSAWKSLEDQLHRLQAEESDLRRLIGTLNELSGKLKEKMTALASSIETLNEQKDAAQTQMEAAEQQLQVLHTGWPEFDLEARLQYASQEARSIDLAHADGLRENVLGHLMSSERTMSETLQEH